MTDTPRAPSPSLEMQALDALAPALDATKSCTDGCDHEGVEWHYSTVDDFATALRAALIEQAKGAEPIDPEMQAEAEAALARYREQAKGAE
jgi:hypothetical protein